LLVLGGKTAAVVNNRWVPAVVNYRQGHLGHLLVSIGSIICQKSNFLYLNPKIQENEESSILPSVAIAHLSSLFFHLQIKNIKYILIAFIPSFSTLNYPSHQI